MTNGSTQRPEVLVGKVTEHCHRGQGGADKAAPRENNRTGQVLNPSLWPSVRGGTETLNVGSRDSGGGRPLQG